MTQRIASTTSTENDTVAFVDEVVDVVVRHRVEDGHNTSWALVTMESEASAQKALDNEVFAGKQKLVINRYKAKQAAASDGAMAKARNRQLKVQERAQEMAMAKGKGKLQKNLQANGNACQSTGIPFINRDPYICNDFRHKNDQSWLRMLYTPRINSSQQTLS